MADRQEIFEKIRRKTITKSDAAKLLGISRTRITQLMNKKQKGGPPMASAPVVVKPSPVDPLREVFAGPTPEPPPPSPKDLADVLRPTNPEPSPTPAGTPGAIPVDAVPHEEKQVNAEDAQAGRELIRWLTKFCREGMAKFVYRVPASDPRMAELKEENKFLEIAMRRNSEKAAPLGFLTNGWKGLIIGYTMEVIRVAFTLTPGKPSSGAGAPPPSPGPAPSRPTAPAPSPAAPSAPPPEAKTVEEVRGDIEAPTRPRLSLEERIAKMNQGG